MFPLHYDDVASLELLIATCLYLQVPLPLRHGGSAMLETLPTALLILLGMQPFV